MRSDELFARAKAFIPGGVNSPVRAFGSVGMTPRFIARGDGDRLWDADGQEYIDYIGSWGPMILGHGHPEVLESVAKAIRDGLSFGAATEREVEMAEQICTMVPSVEMVRMVNSGTEAVMSALRAARGFTGRDKIIKFAGCYHGHTDAMLVDAGSGLMTQGIPGSAGVPEGCTKDTLTAAYNDLDSVRALFEANPGEIAAVIVEPVGANMGVVLPEEGFLPGLRSLCDENGALLIFDEVITGFRLGPSGAQGFYGVKPDLTTFGKIIGGGMPVGAYGGRRDIMSNIAPLGLPGGDAQRQPGGDGRGPGAAARDQRHARSVLLRAQREERRFLYRSGRRPDGKRDPPLPEPRGLSGLRVLHRGAGARLRLRSEERHGAVHPLVHAYARARDLSGAFPV